MPTPDLVQGRRIGAAGTERDPATVYGGDAREYTCYPAPGQTDGMPVPEDWAL